KLRDQALDDEPLVVRIAGGLKHVIRRNRERAFLQTLLQLRLRVFGNDRGVEAFEIRRVQPQNHRERRFDAAIEIDRSEDRLERVGENRVAVESAALQLAPAERERVAERERT